MNIGLLGCGTVGSGVFEIIYSNREKFQNAYKNGVEIKKILIKDKAKDRNLPNAQHLITTDAYEILDDPSIEMIIEVIGGVEEAYEFIRYALNNGKHVVTANKAVVAKYLKELLEVAERNNRAFLFEGSVGGGIPLLKPLKQCAQLDNFYEVKGILNGTSNFILTKMMEENLDFEEALTIAQRLGYAEANPEDDIGGADVARKLAILSAIAFKRDIRENAIPYRGIQEITKVDMNRIKKLGYVVKLLGKAVIDNTNFSALVEPVLVKNNDLFEKVNNEYNLVSLKGSHLKELQFYGEGAGKYPTGNAVVCDVLDIVGNAYHKQEIYRREKLEFLGAEGIKGKYFVRIHIATQEEKNFVIDLFDKQKIAVEKSEEKNHLFLVTEKTDGNTMGFIGKVLEKSNFSFFYGRIEEDDCI